MHLEVLKKNGTFFPPPKWKCSKVLQIFGLQANLQNLGRPADGSDRIRFMGCHRAKAKSWGKSFGNKRIFLYRKTQTVMFSYFSVYSHRFC
ncbi:hypothetical protein CEXT_743591 [Caerostris extrusa]|uniref:Uncharacterized protein n=1 Tax=Caerostris extrusa TaxID=172846 RepID=A0AAV4MAP2_CAEEX|nr:hypothetical protein CEXT_743591 [Caerostris extrusa]